MKTERIHVGWLVGPVLALLLLGHGFGAEWQDPPSGQPAQMWSKVDYDPKLTDPFFKSNGSSYQDPGMTPERKPRWFKHTAKCLANSCGVEHSVRFSHATLLDGDMIDLLIAESDGAFNDQLRVQIRNGGFSSQYWTHYVGDPGDVGLIWTTKRQKLTLDKKEYRKGAVIKGRIDFECVQEIGNPKYAEKWGRSPTTIKVYGVFKTIVK